MIILKRQSLVFASVYYQIMFFPRLCPSNVYVSTTQMTHLVISNYAQISYLEATYLKFLHLPWLQGYAIQILDICCFERACQKAEISQRHWSVRCIYTHFIQMRLQACHNYLDTINFFIKSNFTRITNVRFGLENNRSLKMDVIGVEREGDRPN